MSRLEDELRNALRRQDAPAGFAHRVVARLGQARSPQPTWRELLFGPFWRRAMAGALACLILLGGFMFHYQQQRREDGERAKAQVMLALRITGSKVRRAQQMVRHINVEEHSSQRSREGL